MQAERLNSLALALKDHQKRIDDLAKHLELDLKKDRLNTLLELSNDANIWQDAKQAQAILKEKKQVEDVVNVLNELQDNISALQEMFDLAKDEHDAEINNSSNPNQAIEENTQDAFLIQIEEDNLSILAQIQTLEFRQMFHNPHDPNNCFIDIQAGAGGTEACDWASMLLRQYLRYCERKGFKAVLLEETSGDVAGIKSASIKVEGDYAFGYLRTETGVHRLVRKSPFDSNNGRHTSFASIFVYPEVEDDIEIEVNPADLRVDTFRASGAGGQHINKTDSAVRITHLPTNIVVQCQNDRSQHRNRDEAMKMLKSRLYEHELRKKLQAQQKLEDSKSDVAWGHQIRSYVLDQSRIKDLRTNVEVSHTKSVLDGDLDIFIEESLKQQV